MIGSSKYSVWFRTPIGAGAGIVDLEPTGELNGADSTYVYNGRWKQDGDRFSAKLLARRISPGPPGVFGVDEIDVAIVETERTATTVSCTGFAKQAPGLKLEVTLIRMGAN